MVPMPGDDSPAPPDRSGPYRAFLPGGMPLHGDYARHDGVLYSARPEGRGGTLSPGERVVLSRIGERPGPDWEMTPVFQGSPHSQWTREIEQSQAQELFRCRGSASWRGLEFDSPTYLPAGNLVGGFIHHVARSLEPRLEGIHRLERVDQTTWYGYVPLDGIEDLEIHRVPWPEKTPGPGLPRRGRKPVPRGRLLARLFGARPGSQG